MKRKKSKMDPADLPEPSNDPIRSKREREKSPLLCPSCGMDDDLPVEGHGPPCELRKLLNKRWTPPATPDEPVTQLDRVRSAAGVTPTVVGTPAPASAPSVAAETPARSGEQLSLMALPDVQMAGPARAVAERGRSLALSFDQVDRPSRVALSIDAPPGTELAISINLNGGQP